VKNALRKEETNSSRVTLITSAASEGTWLLRRRQQDWSLCCHEQAWTGYLLSERHACFKFRYSFSPSTILIACAPLAWWPCCALRGIWARKVELLTQLSFLLHWSGTRPFRRRNGLVRVATRLQGGQLKSRGSNDVRGKRLFPST